MRTLGPGSIASLLKIALDVAYALVWCALGASLLLLVGGLLAIPFLSAHLAGGFTLEGRTETFQDLERRWPFALCVLASGALYLGVLLAIFFRLRQVFVTLSAGDPFRPENVGRLRAVGLGLIGLEAAGYLARLTGGLLFPDIRSGLSGGVSLSAWFAILVVFVLAEVFREGARLRREAELTI